MRTTKRKEVEVASQGAFVLKGGPATQLDFT